MKISTENNIRWLVTENENNFIYDKEQISVVGKRLIPAKSITEENVHNFFTEISSEEANKLNQETNNPIQA